MSDETYAESAKSTAPGTPSRSLLSAYSSEYFMPTVASDQLLRILAGRNGASIGLAGPRGAGKSWLMENAIKWANHEKGVGVWFPSPSEYEPNAFLASISDVIAIAYQAYYDKQTGETTALARARYYGGILLSSVTLLAGYGLLILGVPTFGTSVVKTVREFLNVFTVAGLILSGFSVYLLFRTRNRYRRERIGQGRVRAAAEELRRQVGFALTTKESLEVGGEGKRAGLGATFKRAQERQLVERPATLSSLIQNFRAFTKSMAEAVEGPVVICIDELDKMTDVERVAQLLRDVKGIFDIQGVFTLVSISDEAARFLDLGTVKARNEFNSSFYTVISAPLLDVNDSANLLTVRASDLPHNVGLAAGVLSAGVPRDVVRVGDALYQSRDAGGRLEHLLFLGISNELRSFVDQVIALPHRSEGGRISARAADKLAIVGAMPTSALADLKKYIQLAGKALSYWDLLREGGEDPNDILEEEWRRILVRLSVVRVLISSTNLLTSSSDAEQIQGIMVANSGSAEVGRSLLARYVLLRAGASDTAIQHIGSHAATLAGSIIERLDDQPIILRLDSMSESERDALVSCGVVRKARHGFKSEWVLSNYARMALNAGLKIV